MAFTYPGIRVDQRPGTGAVPLMLLSAPAGQIVAWAEVARLGHDGEGVQRRKNEAKVKAIGRFLAADEHNTLPSALTIALWDVTIATADDGCSSITIPLTEEGGRGLVIDGQHRLYGAVHHDPTLPLNVVALLNPDDLEVAFQFLVINNKATKVPTDHIRLLSLGLDDADLGRRLRTARMSLSKSAALVGIADSDEESPFFRSVIWPVDPVDDDAPRLNLVRPAALETAMASIAQKDLVGLDNEDALISFFYALWQAIKDAWGGLWVPDSRLLGKAGFVAMTQFLMDDLAPLVDRGRLDAANTDDVAQEVALILAGLEPDFWASEWTMQSLDTSAGRGIIVDALQKVRRNRQRGEPWYAGIQLVSVTPTEDMI